MEFKEQVLDLLADVAENDVVKRTLMSKYSKRVLLIHSKR